MTIRVFRTGDDLTKRLEFAATYGNVNINRAMVVSSREMASTAKKLAPKYDTTKYPEWAHMKHAHRVGGRLRKHIKTRSVAFKNAGRVTISARSYYASYMERGFRHVLAKRIVFGRWYMLRSYHNTFLPSAERNLTKAFHVTFGDGSFLWKIL
jgi:hypothetical protein